MNNVKVTNANIETILNDIQNEAGTAREDTFFFAQSEINESTIRQMAWDKNLILSFQALDSFIVKFTFSQTLN